MSVPIAILTGLFGDIAASIIYDGVKKILGGDPFKKAFIESVDEASSRHKEYALVFDELREKPENFISFSIVKKEEFVRILSEKGVKEKVAKELYDDIAKKFNEIIHKARIKDERVFRGLVLEKLEEHGEQLVMAQKGIYEIKELLKPKIPKIENVLGKEKYTEPQFFRSYGIQWIDFEKGYVRHRKEVGEIIKRFEKEDIVAIKGKPASGKSIVLRSVGYELAKKRKEVYVIELKGAKPMIEEVMKLRDCYLLIDDVHLDPSYVDNLIRNLSNVKILLSSREMDYRFGPTTKPQLLEYFENAIEIEAVDVADGIIEIFEEKNEKVPKEVKEKLTKNNLWILAWQLKVYEKTKKMDEETIHEEVMRYIKRDLGGNAENILLPLAIAYQYEIPLRKEFVEELSGNGDIKRLLDMNEIRLESENGYDYLALHHSETAKIFLFAYEKSRGFGSKVKKKIGDYENLFHIYIKEYSEESINVII